MEAYDFKLDDDGDLYIDPVLKDLVIAKSDRQHIRDLLAYAPGHLKEFPLVGWNPYKRLNAKTSRVQNNLDAKNQLLSDGYEVRDIDLTLSSDGVIELNRLDVYRP